MQAVVNSVPAGVVRIEEISQASREQTDGIEQINQAVAQMDQGTQSPRWWKKPQRLPQPCSSIAQEPTQVVATLPSGTNPPGAQLHADLSTAPLRLT